MTEQSKAKNKDYSNSALSLTNPPMVKTLLDKLAEKQKLLFQANLVLEEELRGNATYLAVKGFQTSLSTIRTNLEQAIVEFGGYQDVDAGIYALKQRRIQRSYDSKKVKKFIKDYADVILTGVDAKKLKGLVVGGLVPKEAMEQCEIRREYFTFVIDTGVKG